MQDRRMEVRGRKSNGWKPNRWKSDGSPTKIRRKSDGRPTKLRLTSDVQNLAVAVAMAGGGATLQFFTTQHCSDGRATVMAESTLARDVAAAMVRNATACDVAMVLAGSAAATRGNATALASNALQLTMLL
jgi:hypothetical protein